MINFYHYMYFITWFRHYEILLNSVVEWWRLQCTTFSRQNEANPRLCPILSTNKISYLKWSSSKESTALYYWLTMHSATFLPLPSVRREGRVRGIVWTLLRHKEWLHSYWDGRGSLSFLPLWVFLFLFFQNCYQILCVRLSTYCREIRKCFRRLVELCNEVSTCSSKHHQVQQRVRSKSVGSMNWCACRLPGCPQSWHYFIFAILDWQCLQEGQNNSHTQKQGHVFYRDVLFERGRVEGKAANLSHLGTPESAVWCSAAKASVW